MPDLLLELLSEEIPARMQGKAAEDLRRIVTNALVENGLLYEAAQAFATPRRLALHVVGLPARAQDVREERRGPRVGAPEAALSGFLKSAGLTSVDELTVVSDAKKGDSYVAVIARPGRPAPEVVAELMPGIIRSFPWPKSMRWGAASRVPGSLRWVRPLQSILCAFASETESAVVPFAVDGIASGDMTRGHRFLSAVPIRVRRYDDYVAALAAAHVVLDPARRRDVIRHDARDLAFAQGLEVVEDEALLDEVAGLVEQPVVLMGAFEESFLAIPPEAIRATIRANQKCFVLRSTLPLAGRVESREAGPGWGSGASSSTPTTPTPSPSPQGGGEGALSNRFILVSNLLASDRGAAIVAGNERVVRARLSDAKFFWDTDRKLRLEDRLDRLGAIIFHEKLGTQGERVERIAALARELAPSVGADPDLAERAARLCKADLVTEMVGEFPELQGVMGRYYALEQGEDPAVAAAIADHYKPLGPSDRVPNDPVTVAVALADKLDTLVGFWAIGETPTGSKDPYALRRAALGVVRLVLENSVGLELQPLLLAAERRALLAYFFTVEPIIAGTAWLSKSGSGEWIDDGPGVDQSRASLVERLRQDANPTVGELKDVADLLAFFHDRLKVYLRDRGARHDLIDAVLAAGRTPQQRHAEERPQAASRSTQDRASFETQASPAPQDDEGGGEIGGTANDDLLTVVRRVEALGRFLDTPDGLNLLAATKRAANILRIEEKKDGRSYDEPADPAALAVPEEIALAEALEPAEAEAGEAVGREDFEDAMRALAALRPTVDAFFDKVTVNAPEPEVRANRLRLLATLRRATRAVADFSRIEG